MASDMAIPRIPYEWIEYITYCCVDDSLRDSAETDEAARGLEHRSKLLDLAAATVNTTLWSPYPRILTDWPPKHGVNIE